MPDNPLAYYPGCSGLGTSAEYDMSTRGVCSALHIILADIPDWNCCGSSPAHMVDHSLAAALSARNLAQAEDNGLTDIVTPCPSCLKNLKTAAQCMQDPARGPKAAALLGRSLKQRHRIRSVLQVLAEDMPEGALAAKLKKPLTGLQLVPYYGCLLTRPADLMAFDDTENPTSMDRLLEAAGAAVLPFPHKVDCCGASMAIPKNEAVTRLSGRILDAAVAAGADVVAVACPLCQMNLDLRQGQINRANSTRHNIPVMYFTQLLGIALGLPEKDLGLEKLSVDPRPMLAAVAARTAASATTTTAKTEGAA